MDPVTNEWVTKNEQKKRKTKRKKEAEAAAKAATKKDAPTKKKAEKADAPVADESDPTKYTDIRKKMLQDMRDAGKEGYPHKFQKDMTIP